MKIDRLIGIITILQQNKKVTAPYLAERFEVSRRTINRDIEDICRAGIPIVTSQGAGGGIALMDGFSLDTTVFTQQEVSAIFTGLKTLDSISNTSSADKLVRKIGGESAVTLSDMMVIDLASYYKENLTTKIEQLQKAIKERHIVSFEYYYRKGEIRKWIEPYLIVFKWSAWYVFGYCKERQDFRMFKLQRLWDLSVSDDVFVEREVPEEKKQFGFHNDNTYYVTARYSASTKYRLVEEYGPDSFTVCEDGSLMMRRGFDSRDEALYWFMGFSDQVQVLEPPEMVDLMRETVQRLSHIYCET